ncbi:hypothetical protein L2E82_14023 [Cichorium intybus]|uniref:Uncharacterized protein n=1 Tax=Cichorium intybus TaxID=13427 RepID=A0ACB9EZG3_CICIN|nr:hypothetical protein L2E82_14023 [Cichorium intybus]
MEKKQQLHVGTRAKPTRDHASPAATVTLFAKLKVLLEVDIAAYLASVVSVILVVTLNGNSTVVRTAYTLQKESWSAEEFKGGNTQAADEQDELLSTFFFISFSVCYLQKVTS